MDLYFAKSAKLDKAPQSLLPGTILKNSGKVGARTLYTLDSQWPLSSVLSIIMEKSTQPG
jgi:hypothetical protein